MKSQINIGVILCRCGGRIDRKLNLKALKNYVSGLAGVRSVSIKDQLCTSPAALKEKRLRGIVVAACSVKKHIELFRDSLETSQIPVSRCAFVDLRGIADRRMPDAVISTEMAKLIIKAHVEKLAASPAPVPNARRGGVAQAMDTSRGAVTRRGFLRLPLIASNIISPYEEMPMVDGKRCVAAMSPCRGCIRQCPANALEFKEGKVRVIHHLCLQCGLCATICPVDAVQMPTFSAFQGLKLVDALADRAFSLEHRALIFTCDKGCENLSVKIKDLQFGRLNLIIVRVPCVASLLPGILLRSIELGFEALAVLCPDKNCRKTTALDVWKYQMSSVFKGIKFQGAASRLAFFQINSEEKDDLSQLRNHLLLNQKAGSLNPNPVAVPPDLRSGLIRILGALVQDESFLNASIKGISFPFFDLQIAQEKCCLCGACARQCPAAALEIIGAESETQIQFSTARCIGCGQCVAICPGEAISLTRTMNLLKLSNGETEIKISEENARCKRCGTVIGKKRLLKEVEKKMKKSGFETLAARTFYCQACRNIVDMEGPDCQCPESSNLQEAGSQNFL